MLRQMKRMKPWDGRFGAAGVCDHWWVKSQNIGLIVSLAWPGTQKETYSPELMRNGIVLSKTEHFSLSLTMKKMLAFYF